MFNIAYTMRHGTIAEFNMDQKAECGDCGQLNLAVAHVTRRN